MKKREKKRRRKKPHPKTGPKGEGENGKLIPSRKNANPTTVTRETKQMRKTKNKKTQKLAQTTTNTSAQKKTFLTPKQSKPKQNKHKESKR